MAKIKGGDRHLEIFSTLFGDGGVLKLSPFCIPLLLKEGSESCWRSKNVRRVYENEERFFFVTLCIISFPRALFIFYYCIKGIELSECIYAMKMEL